MTNSTIQLPPAALLQEGIHEDAPTQIVGPVFGFSGQFDISQHLDPEVIVTHEIFISMDGGASWVAAGGATRPGGPGLDRLNNPISVCPFFGGAQTHLVDSETGKVVQTLPNSQSPLVKNRLTISGGSLMTSFACAPIQQPIAVVGAL